MSCQSDDAKDFNANPSEKRKRLHARSREEEGVKSERAGAGRTGGQSLPVLLLTRRGGRIQHAREAAVGEEGGTDDGE